MHKTGRPVLVGTTSVEKSEIVCSLLQEAGIPFEVLNAKPENVERESEIVAQSGRKGAVTIATNMAGRGTDILLGGNPEFMARLKLREMLLPTIVNLVDQEETRRLKPLTVNSWNVNPKIFPCDVSKESLACAKAAVDLAVETWGAGQLAELDAEERLAFACEKAPTSDPVVQKIREAFLALEADFKKVTDEEKVEVQNLGGLHVVGTERHESRRIDNQVSHFTCPFVFMECFGVMTVPVVNNP